MRSFSGCRRRWRERSGAEMAAAAELAARGRCWLWLFVGLQAVRGRAGSLALGTDGGFGS